MRCNIDLRFLFPPLVSIFLPWFISSGGNSSNNTMISIPQFVLVLALSLLFLAVPIKVSINFSVIAPTMGLQSSSGEVFFSGLLGVTLLASFLCTPSHFWLVYLICVSIAPWSASFLAALKSCFQAIPIFVVTTRDYLATMFTEVIAINAPEQLVNQPGAGAADLPQAHPLQIEPVNFLEAEVEEYIGQLHGHA